MMTRLRRGLMLRPQAQPVTIPAFWPASEASVIVPATQTPGLFTEQTWDLGLFADQTWDFELFPEQTWDD